MNNKQVDSRNLKKRNNPTRRNHDGFFRYIYSKPTNAKTLLTLAREANRELDAMLEDVNLDTLTLFPGFYNEVGEKGESDLAFTAKAYRGKDVFVGILLEHKSASDRALLDQVGRYAFNVMVNKNDPEFRWYPTKAIIIYNGKRSWDPVAAFKRKNRAKFQGKDLPFELVMVNMSELNDESCLTDGNVEAAIGALILKYAFDKRGLSDLARAIGERLWMLGNYGKNVFLDKINLYLGEFIDEESLEELQMAWKSIGQRLGFVSAGDARRAAERAGRRAGMKKGMEKGMEKGIDKVIELLRSQGVSKSIIAKAEALK